MLKLKGQTESGKWVEFGIDEIWGTNKAKCILNGDFPKTVLLTDTIKLADDQRKAMLDEIRNQLAVLPSPSFCDDCFNDGFGEAVHKVFDLIDEMEAKLGVISGEIN